MQQSQIECINQNIELGFNITDQTDWLLHNDDKRSYFVKHVHVNSTVKNSSPKRRIWTIECKSQVADPTMLTVFEKILSPSSLFGESDKTPKSHLCPKLGEVGHPGLFRSFGLSVKS